MRCPCCRKNLQGAVKECVRCSTRLHAHCWGQQGCVVVGCRRVRWHDLKDWERGRLRSLGELNGCGSKASWVPVPDLVFADSCDHHDFNYWLGGGEADRLKADWQFLQVMLRLARKGRWWNRWWLSLIARFYYRAVRRFARPHFHHGKQRMRSDLDQVLRTDRPIGRQ